MTTNKPTVIAWAPSLELAKLSLNGGARNGVGCVLTDGPTQHGNDAALIRLSDYEARMAVLFDGHAVYRAMTDKAKQHTSPESVAAVLDAVVRLMQGKAS